MKILKIEALADSLSYLNKAYQADSESYKLRNPLMLKNYAAPGRHDITEEGYRVFNSFTGGYKSGLYDLEVKINGKSNTGLQSTDTLGSLLKVYGIKQEADILTVVYFLRKAIDPTISISTPLTYFKD